MSEIPASAELMDLIFTALDHGTSSVEAARGPLTPFALIEEADGRKLARFAAPALEEGQAHARRALREAENALRAAIAYDGYVTIEGERTDAIFVEAQERDRDESLVFAQRYRPAGRLKRFSTIGNAAYLGSGEPLF